MLQDSARPGRRPVIETRQLTKRFGDMAAVADLTCQVDEGELVGHAPIDEGILSPSATDR
jgi:hypothetical protein